MNPFDVGHSLRLSWCGSMNDIRPPAPDSAPDPDLRDLRRQLDTVSSRDFGRLLGRWRGLSRRPGRREAGGAGRRHRALGGASDSARVAAKPAIRLDESLPISARGEDIIALIRKHQVVVIAGETGSGKTTQLPKLCLAAGRGEAGMIGCTQPRRLAARSVARRVAEELGTPVGEIVGFQVRFNDQVSERSLIKFMTDGILLAETQGDPWLSRVRHHHHRRGARAQPQHRLSARLPEAAGVEAAGAEDHRDLGHDRYRPLRRALRRCAGGRGGRARLSGRVALACGGAARVAGGHGSAEAAKAIARRPRRPSADMQQGSAEHIAAVLDEITADDPRGDVLIFLPGEREIRDAHLLLSRRQYRETEIMPLYARLSAGDQDRVFKPGIKRRVVLATNVAETSLTVPRIRYVIDTGTCAGKALQPAQPARTAACGTDLAGGGGPAQGPLWPRRSRRVLPPLRRSRLRRTRRASPIPSCCARRWPT